MIYINKIRYKNPNPFYYTPNYYEYAINVQTYYKWEVDDGKFYLFKDIKEWQDYFDNYLWSE